MSEFNWREYLKFSPLFVLYKSFLFFISKRKSFLISMLCGLTHPYFIFSITSVLTESFSFFLISASLYYFLVFFRTNRQSALLVTSFLLGYLVLTKVFF